LGAGATNPERRTFIGSRGFNSHPPLGAGATCLPQLCASVSALQVSILTRPWGRVQREPIVNHWRKAARVSILTRPWGRVQLCHETKTVVRNKCFNSHPPLGAGATLSRGSIHGLYSGFNSHPPLGAGATRRKSRTDRGPLRQVSILTRPWGRVQRVAPRVPSRTASGFNSHPPLGAGATCLGRRRCVAAKRRFNSHPPLGAGAT